MKYEEWKIPYEKQKRDGEIFEAGYPPLLAALLSKRGLTRKADAERFLFSGEELLEDPMLLPDMQKAIERVERAVSSGERTVIYGDYDVDGITAACMLTDYLRKRGADCELYIPDRIEEGYGLNAAAVEMLRSRGTGLIITVDCGITAIDETDLAARLKVDMIITDHHECTEALPRAEAVINPKRPDSAYPCRELAGVGVAFKLICAMEKNQKTMLAEYSDLIAVGTVADVVPLTGENRFLVRAGTEKLKNDPRPGFAALLKQVKTTGKMLNAVTIGYAIAPRINAAGRLGRADVAVSLLNAASEEEAEESARELSGLNRRRRELEQLIWEQAKQRLEECPPEAPIVLADEAWHQGVIGIAASRLTEMYGFPAVIICLDGEKGKGSCRSPGGFNMLEALGACSEHLVSFGGHAQAAGLNIKRDKIDDFRRALCEYYQYSPTDTESRRAEPELRVDEPELLSVESTESIDLLEPFGNGNPRPLLCITDAVLESITPLKDGKHLRIYASKFGRSLECVFFSQRPEELGALAGDFADLAFCPQINEFRSRTTVQLILSGLRKFDGAGLIKRLTNGDMSPAEAGENLPERADFAAIWKNIRQRGGQIRGRLPEIMRALDARMTPGKFFVCLSVFGELGLIELSESGEELSVLQTETEGKTDLNASLLMRALSVSVSRHSG
ncbi:MAG: single-stranded-DNA-specific exonuclease RecJ [Oscillospiraceae bacterium]|nr:single-stranded-DNA-specific exonuclease RecJ [Oscillospiraceae bacterium]